MNWTILNELKIIDGYSVQKAIVKSFGRNWTAWFSSSYIFPDGPYKFNGLPGIIVLVEDFQKGHIFSLKGVKILSDNNEIPLEILNKKINKSIKVTKKQYQKVFIEQREDPLKDWKPRMGGAIRLQATYNGKPMDAKELEKASQERLKKENNILELDLLAK